MGPLNITLCNRGIPGRVRPFFPLDETLEAAGHSVTVVRDGPVDLTSSDVVWLQGNANWYPNACRQLAATPRRERPFVLIWHTEPLPPPKAAGLPWPRPTIKDVAKFILRDTRATDVYTNYLRIRSLVRQGIPDLILASSQGRCEFLAERGIQSCRVPLAYHPLMGTDLGLTRDIDVLFLGALNVPRRNRLLEQLRTRRVNLMAVGDWFDPAFWGEDRTRLLNRAKILVNFGRAPGELSGYRLLLGMANKALVISEPIYKPDPYIPGKHFVMTRVEEMPEMIEHYLRHETEREQILTEAYRFVTDELTLARSVDQILVLLEGRIKDR
jgi:hypothetical protein